MGLIFLKMTGELISLIKENPEFFYKIKEWLYVRQLALERDNYECQMCKAEGRVHVDSKKVPGERKPVELNVHHIKELEDFPELALELDNLVTLCVEHHNEVHGRFGGTINKWAHDERW